MGTVDSLMKLFRAGDHVVCGENVYGGTFRLFDKILRHFGMEFSFVDTRHVDKIDGAVKKNTRAILVETPSNPLMRVTDIRAAADIAHKNKALLIVDNTFASPVFQRPFEFGADVVFHSTTKYLNGHSDMIGGIAIVKDDELAERIQFILNAAGAVPGPFDAWLALRGTKTLHLRMRQHDANGRAVSRWLVDQLGAESVMYVGLTSHPQHELAKRQMCGFGGMLAFDLGSLDAARRLLNAVRLHALAESLGGVETLISHPSTDRKSTRLNSSHIQKSRMPSSA